MDPVAIAGAAVGVAGLITLAVPYFRATSTKGTIDLLQQALDIERRERKAQEERCRNDIADLREKHAHDMGELRGQLNALTDDFLERLVDRFASIAERNRHA